MLSTQVNDMVNPAIEYEVHYAAIRDRHGQHILILQDFQSSPEPLSKRTTYSKLSHASDTGKDGQVSDSVCL